MSNRIAIWDWPVRAFHWLLVILVPLQWWLAEEDRLELHILVGEFVLGLVLFRIIWGLVGSSTARFANFVRGPRAIRGYLSGRWQGIGHNPVGALSVVALLLLLAVQIGLGLFASDEDGLYSGPLAHLVSIDASETLAERHEQVFWILVGFIGLHIAAVLYYLLVKRDNLVAPMVTGGRDAKAGETAMAPAPASRFFIAAGLAAALTWGIVTLI